MASLEQLISDLEGAEIRHGIEQGFWQLKDRSELRVYFRVTAPDDRLYLAELDCSGYGDEPIAGRFVDKETRECVSSAWPKGNGTFTQWVKYDPSNLFICWDQDRVGISHHQEWRPRRAWKKGKNQIYTYLDFIRKLLYVPSNGYCRES